MLFRSKGLQRSTPNNSKPLSPLSQSAVTIPLKNATDAGRVIHSLFSQIGPNVVHNYPINRPYICYRVDVNDQGFFTHPKEIIAEHGDSDEDRLDRTCDNMVHEQVSCGRLF